MKIVLYKWPPSPGVDAANPRGVTINRILTYLKIDYTARIVNPTRAELDPEKLGNWISGFPVVSINGRAVNGIYRILRTLSADLKSEPPLKLWDTDSKIFELSSWAFDHLYFLAIYAWLNRPSNYFRYAEAVAKSNGDPNTQTVALMRDLFLESLKWSSVGILSETDFREVLLSSLDALEQRLKSPGPFLISSEVSLADFAVFGPIQALLDPEIEERELITKHCPKLIEWARRIDSRTTGKWTRELVNL